MLDGVYEASPDKLASLHEENAAPVAPRRRRASAVAGRGRAAPAQARARQRCATSLTIARHQLCAAGRDAGRRAPVRSRRPTRWRRPWTRNEYSRSWANLLSNALHHTPPPNGTITLSAVDGRNQVEIAVADTGPGIAPENLPHVSRRPVLAGAIRSDHSDSSGLGCWPSCAGWPQAHGGAVWAESHAGPGRDLFHVSLPRGG